MFVFLTFSFLLTWRWLQQTAVLAGGTLWYLWLAELLKPDLPSTVSAGCDKKNKNQKNPHIQTRVSKRVHYDLKRARWKPTVDFFMHALHYWFSPPTSKDWFLTNPDSFLSTPSSAVQLERATHFSSGLSLRNIFVGDFSCVRGKPVSPGCTKLEVGRHPVVQPSHPWFHSRCYSNARVLLLYFIMSFILTAVGDIFFKRSYV